ncbi:ABC transporter permease subunit [Actinotalea sp. K2]|uniref:ABC transporter permease n=1 Tax=Actinotalea sp. K2 TaxID=2939438 RepID=UPI0020171C12|nr:ABC transporter permease subunit [Actinotalea sp. K2]MCL3861704.1 ABC transporter permease subunit [Actinotalea sp. K2]
MTARRWVLAVPVLLVLTVALAGPWVPAGSVTAPIGASFAPPTAEHPLGTDVLGRDVFARALAGGRVLVAQAVAATLLGSLVGLTVGVWAGVTHHRAVGRSLMRVVDGLAALPALLLLMLLATGMPGNDVAVAAGIAIVSAPFSVRVLHESAARLAATDYARHAEARGEGLLTRTRSDILPGLVPVALAEAGIRFVAATQLAATAGFLGLGAGAPVANWGRMVRENSTGAAMNPLPVIVPAALLVVLAVSVTVLIDRTSVSTRLAPERIERAA